MREDLVKLEMDAQFAEIGKSGMRTLAYPLYVAAKTRI
jgi:hypothetical protein